MASVGFFCFYYFIQCGVSPPPRILCKLALNKVLNYGKGGLELHDSLYIYWIYVLILEFLFLIVSGNEFLSFVTHLEVAAG